MEIVCLPGMGRSRYSMSLLARHLVKEGHNLHLFGYHQRSGLAEAARRLSVFLERKGLDGGGEQVGFIGHSAGGVLLRYLAAELPHFRAGRSVALGSPLGGSIIAEHYSRHWITKLLNAPILESLHPENVHKLPGPPCALASVAGTAQSILLPAGFLLRFIAAGQASDATVLVAETKFEGMSDWVSVPVVHTLLPTDKRVIALVSRYLKFGTFTTP